MTLEKLLAKLEKLLDNDYQESLDLYLVGIHTEELDLVPFDKNEINEGWLKAQVLETTKLEKYGRIGIQLDYCDGDVEGDHPRSRKTCLMSSFNEDYTTELIKVLGGN